MHLAILWLQLAGAAIVILGASNFLAKSADVIAFKTGLGRAFIGVVLLATATSLPELGTGVSSIALVDKPDLAVGDAFGSNLFNLLIIGLLDLFWRNGPILGSVSIAAVLIGSLGIVVIGLGAVALLIHSETTAMGNWTLSPVSVVILVVFLAAMFLIYKFEQRERNDGDFAAAGLTDENEDDKEQYADESTARTVVIYALSAGFVVGAAIWLSIIGEKITEEMGWEASFVGTQFLAFSTSLPELAASFAAIRINAPELAITGVLGSNLFNMGFILFMDDVALVGAPLWDNVSDIHMLTAVVAMLMTAVVIGSVVSRGRGRPNKFFTFEALALIALYAGASVLVFILGD
jgi:cation:H+ antiporter